MPSKSSELSGEDIARATLYRILAALLANVPDQRSLEVLQSLRGDPSTEVGVAVNAVAASAREVISTPRELKDEFNTLFIGLVRGELLPYASYYLTGFLHEKPLARLRGDMAGMGIAAQSGVPEPEDHIATICEIMAGLVDGAVLGEPASPEAQARFFSTHLEPWAPVFFGDLQKADAARFYRAVGRLGAAFVDVERRAFEMT
ncbi:MAG: molecular chaperone [Hyphomicrobiaceae bacterium]